MYNPEYSNSKHKDYVRDLVMSYTIKKYRRTFTLPNLNFSLENKMVSNDFIVHTAEYNPEVFEQQKQLIANNRKIILHLGKTSDVINSLSQPTNSFDVSYLDYCSSFSKEIHKTLVSIKSNVIVLTLMKARDVYLHSLIKQLGREAAHKYIFYSMGYEILDTYKYQGTAPMIVYVLKSI